jgi:hypothetical protein
MCRYLDAMTFCTVFSAQLSRRTETDWCDCLDHWATVLPQELARAAEIAAMAKQHPTAQKWLARTMSSGC